MKRPPKNLLVCFLLLLYLFIAAPVQLWHHHGQWHTDYRSIDKANEDNLIISGETDHQSQVCDICSHRYAVHMNNQLIPTGGRIDYQEPFPARLPSAPRVPSLGLYSNKSPPEKLYRLPAQLQLS